LPEMAILGGPTALMRHHREKTSKFYSFRAQ
jgi:hypothetical protein